MTDKRKIRAENQAEREGGDMTEKQKRAYPTVKSWMKRGTKGHMVVKLGKGNYMLLGNLITLDGVDLGMMQVGMISATGMPTYTWMPRDEVEERYGSKLCYPAETFNMREHDGR